MNHEKTYSVYSSKYDIHGTITINRLSTILSFVYDENVIEMTIIYNPFSNKTYEDMGKDIIDTYIANLSYHEENRKLQLHYWYIDQQHVNGDLYSIAHGIVTGHKKLTDSFPMHTSPIIGYQIDETAGELIVVTMNSVYHCPLDYWCFTEQDNNPSIVPNYDKLREKYIDAMYYPSIEPGKILLVLANFADFLFHSLFFLPTDPVSAKPVEYTSYAHIGMIKDSYCIHTTAYDIDMAYFPNSQGLSLYNNDTKGYPLYIENIGDSTLYVITNVGTIRLQPGERKEVCEDNADDEDL